MRLLLLGRDGQLGRCLALRAAGQAGLKLTSPGRDELDLSVPGAAREAILALRPDAIVNAAAYTAVDQAEDEPELAMRINGDAPGEIAAAAAETGARLIHISTDYVFDGTAAEPYREDAPVAPLNVYGASKLAGERAVMASGANATILRTAWVYSPYGRNFVKTMLRLAESRARIDVVADQRGSPTSADDLAAAILKLLRGPAAAGPALYHLAGAGEASWAEFAAHVFACSAALGGPAAEVLPIPAASFPTKAARPAFSVLDCGLLAKSEGIMLPHWHGSARTIVDRLLNPATLPK